MLSEAQQLAAAFDQLGHQALTQLDGLEHNALHWPLPLPQGDSLYSCAQHLLEESTFWVVETVGGPGAIHLHQQQKEGGKTHSDLVLQFSYWSQRLHQMLDRVPDAILDLFVEATPWSQEVFGEGPTTVRSCLLHALGQCAIQVGRMQFICQLFADGERLLHEISSQDEASEWTA